MSDSAPSPFSVVMEHWRRMELRDGPLPQRPQIAEPTFKRESDGRIALYAGAERKEVYNRFALCLNVESGRVVKAGEYQDVLARQSEIVDSFKPLGPARVSETVKAIRLVVDKEWDIGDLNQIRDQASFAKKWWGKRMEEEYGA